MPHLPRTLSAQSWRAIRLLPIALAAAMAVSACSPEGERSIAAAVPEANMAAAPAPSPVSAAADALGGQNRVRSVAARGESTRSVEQLVALSSGALSPAHASGADKPAAATQRFLAVSHNMQIESPATELAAQWESIKSACEQMDCYVEASGLQRETLQAAAVAYLTMRVNPRDFALLTATLGGNAKVLNHQTSTEDKTSQVVDVEAQIKNRSEYRDSLRELLREKNVKRTLQDLMEIRDTMSQVQAEIDAASTQRALLERETTKQLVQMRFQSARTIVTGTYSPWQQTWQRSWDGMTDSFRTMVLTTATLLPWLVLLLVVGVPLWLGLSKRRRRIRQGAAQTVDAGRDAHSTDTQR